MANEVTVWNKVMSSALAIPGVQVDKEMFLRSELRQYCSKDELEKAVSNPVNVLSEDRIDSLANSCINNHLLKVTSLSVVAGIPGGLAMAATIPADMAQYYWHTFVLAQKLAYLYGIPDLRDENGNLTETSQDMLTLFVGVMMGAAAANNAIKNVSKAFAVQVVKRLPQKALTKTVYYPIIKQVAKWIGIKLTKDTFAKGVGKTIPILGGVISGGLTAATFRPSAKRLQKKLKEQMYDIHIPEGDTEDFVNATFSEVEDEAESPIASENPDKLIIQFMLNLAKVGGNWNERKENLLSNEIESSTLSEDEQLELAQLMNGDKLLQIDFSSIQNDEAYSAKLLEKGVDILKAEDKVALAEKLYFKKIAKQLGFSAEDIEEAMN